LSGALSEAARPREVKQTVAKHVSGGGENPPTELTGKP
jgi:hypothetical protein